MTKSNAAAPYVITVNEYYRLREMLFREHPDALQELITRCNETGTGQVNPDEIWRLAGDKPLFSNMNVKAGRRSERAWREDLFPGWKEMGSPERWNIGYKKSKNARKTDNFPVEGDAAKAFVDKRGKFTTLKNGERFKRPFTAMFRLFAIQSFARWLKANAGEDGQPLAALSMLKANLGPDASIETVAQTCRTLAEQFGLGWGVTTVLHALMDCGFFVVKPDVHLVATVAKLGCLRDPALALDDTNKFLKKEECLFEVVGVARELATRIEPLPQSQGKAIREVDVVLMRAHYHEGLLEKFMAGPDRAAA